ncbi:phytase [Ponticaulis sp.]|uniref:phytase n=1 Tax=Ponticaulis sp. TaxID=2020902 RepID=UPI000B737D97|nr:phytase [Ponticaulis sp.]OUX97507.1 MAG: hypothetical protein CBB65_14015 [Hyphomonadaceae bacterium TMED5]|tara:strand:+ start:8395 stop:9459 length:1065 start_codon:yes stop_codon:yes gene_type:complete
MKTQFAFCAAGAALLASCASVDPNAEYAHVSAIAETESVSSTGDAADDPAVWVNTANPEASLVLGTDKQAGLYVYDLAGDVVQFLPTGAVNNVDLRQDVIFGSAAGIDLAAASNRTINGVTLYEISEAGEVTESTSFPVPTTEPYGLCVGYDENGYRVFVTYKTGQIEIFTVNAQSGGGYTATLDNTLQLSSQLEGCSYDEVQNTLFVGEEEAGLWRIDLNGAEEFARRMVDSVNSGSGLVADVEGIDIWRGPVNTGYLVASAQAGDRYVIYERAAPNRWVGTFSIISSFDGTFDAVTHTDGITVSSAPLGEAFPEGILVVQDDSDGENGTSQNFKFVSWSDVIASIEARSTPE